MLSCVPTTLHLFHRKSWKLKILSMRILLFRRFILHYICLNNVNSMDQTTPHHRPCFLAPSQPCCNWLCHWRGTRSSVYPTKPSHTVSTLSNLRRKSGGNITLKHAHKHWAHLVWHGTIKDFRYYEWYGFIILGGGGGGGILELPRSLLGLLCK